MKLNSKHLLIGGGVLVGGGVLIYLSKLNRLQGNLEIVTRPKIHKVNLMVVVRKITDKLAPVLFNVKRRSK